MLAATVLEADPKIDKFIQVQQPCGLIKSHMPQATTERAVCHVLAATLIEAESKRDVLVCRTKITGAI